MSSSLHPMDCSTVRLPVHHHHYSNSRPSSWWCHPTISSSVVPFASCPQFLPASGSFPMSQVFASGGQRIGVSPPPSVLPMIFRIEFHQDGLVGSPCSPRYSQESSPTPQFKSINSSVLSFLYSPTLTSIHDYWKNHSLHINNLKYADDTTFMAENKEEVKNLLMKVKVESEIAG